MELTITEQRYKFIDLIMNERNVSYKSVYECMEEKKKEIDNMDKIFDKNDKTSKIKCLVTLALVSRKKFEKENLNFFQEEEGLSITPDDIEKYKTVLIAAFFDNIVFFTCACNLCGIVQQEVSKIKEKDKKTGLSKNKRNSAISRLPTRPPQKESMDTVIATVTIWSYCPPENKSMVTYTSADTAGYAPEPFRTYHIDDIKGKYYGEVICSGNRKSKLFELSFQFMDKKTKKPAKKFPFYLNVEIILNPDKKKQTSKKEHAIKRKYNIILDQTINSSTICSKPKKLDFTKGFRIGEIKEVI